MPAGQISQIGVLSCACQPAVSRLLPKLCMLATLRMLSVGSPAGRGARRLYRARAEEGGRRQPWRRQGEHAGGAVCRVLKH